MRDVWNAGGPDGSEISELVEDDAGRVDDGSEVIPSYAAKPTLRVKYTGKQQGVWFWSVIILFFFSLQFIHVFEIGSGVPVATPEKPMNVTNLWTNKLLVLELSSVMM